MVKRYCIREEVIAHTVSGETQSEWVYHYSDNTTESVKGAWIQSTKKGDHMQIKDPWRDKAMNLEATAKAINERNEKARLEKDRQYVRARRELEARRDLKQLGVIYE